MMDVSMAQLQRLILLFKNLQPVKVQSKANVQSKLAKGRIADLSPFAAVNGFVQSWSPYMVA